MQVKAPKNASRGRDRGEISEKGGGRCAAKFPKPFRAKKGRGQPPISTGNHIFPFKSGKKRKKKKKKKNPTTTWPQIENVFFCNWKQTWLMALAAACQHAWSRRAPAFSEINTCTDIQHIRSNYKPRNKRTNKQASAFSRLLCPIPAKLESEAETSGFQEGRPPGSSSQNLPLVGKEGVIVD